MAAYGKRWVFTFNNPPADFDANAKELAERENSPIDFIAFQHEIAPGTGTPHVQGFIIFHVRRRISGCLKIFRCHWEMARGKNEEAYAYVCKEESRDPAFEPYERGVFEVGTGSGKPKALLRIKEMIDTGMPELDICEEEFVTWARCYRALREYKRMKISPRNWKTDVWIVTGPTGSGKSTLANSIAPPEETFMKQNSIWWDGYDAQRVVVLDDFYGWIKYDEMLRLMDRYSLLVQTKGGQSQFLAKTLIMTSNTMPESWYSKIAQSQTGLTAFYRRVDRWIYMGNQISFVGKTYSEFQLKCTLHFALLE